MTAEVSLNQSCYPPLKSKIFELHQIQMNHDDYLGGRALIGDDYDAIAINKWFSEESEGYANLGAANQKTYQYSYHGLNYYHGYGLLKGMRFKHALGLGSAYGDEFKPIINQLDKITIVEPSHQLRAEQLEHLKLNYLNPLPSGDVPIGSAEIDLITCFGVLHHIPNVTKVISEFARILTPGGIALIREPVVSMGDWSKPRSGLTKNERGIPYDLLKHILINSGFSLKRSNLCMCPFFRKLTRFVGISPYMSETGSSADAFLSRLLRWNLRYHAISSLQKIRPTNAFIVAVRK